MISPRLAIAATVLTLAVAVPSTITAVDSASATTASATKYANCTALHKAYRYGVMKPGTKYNVVHHTGKPNTNKKITGSPASNLALYNANSKLDADKDGIACELD